MGCDRGVNDSVNEKLDRGQWAIPQARSAQSVGSS
jgi:hypothetical protein